MPDLPKELVLLSFWLGLGVSLAILLTLLKRIEAWYTKRARQCSKDMESWDHEFPHGMENDDF